MAFSAKGLVAFATLAPPADGVRPPVMAHYSTPDAIADVNTANYFLPAIEQLPLGSILFVRGSVGGSETQSICFVNQNTGLAIDITDGLTITATDTD